ncbi:MAG: DUF421 domain-containing protein [Bacilli bacterium]|jgi:uncharacterized membrane protein YcaP (DUF421 family)
MEYLNLLLKIIFFYFFITIAYKIMGKREVGQLGVIDLIVSILIAELTAISVEDPTKPIFYTIIPVTFLVIVQVSVAYISLKSPKIRILFSGKPSMIINKGKLDFKEMIKQRYNLDDLLLQLREQQIKSLEEIEYAILENNGKLSIFPYQDKKSDLPLPIILDGQVQSDTLKLLKKEREWLNLILNKEKVKIEDIFYAFYKGSKTFIIKKNDIGK